MHKLKNNVICLLLIIIQIVGVVLNISAQTVECNDSQGNHVSINSYLFPWETYSFSIPKGMANWKMYVVNKYDYPVEVKRVSYSNHISSDILETSYVWANSKRFYNELGDTCFYKAFVICENVDNKDTVFMKLAYVPPKPIIKKLELSYDKYDYGYHELINPELSGSVYIPHADYIDILSTSFGQDTIERPPFFWSLDHRLDIESEDGDFKISGQYYDVNQHICFYGTNDYGWSIFSDTILINSLITDKDILDDLHRLSAIETVPSDLNEFVKIRQGEIEVGCDFFHKIEVLDFSGNLIFQKFRPFSGEKIRLKPGIYLLRIIVKDKCYIKKMKL